MNTTLAIVLVGPLGLAGIALAIALAAWVEALVLLVVLRSRIDGLAVGGLARVGVQALVGSVVASTLAFGAITVLGEVIGPNPTAAWLVVEILVTSALFGLAYATVSVVLRIPELASIVGVMADLIRRAPRS